MRMEQLVVLSISLVIVFARECEVSEWSSWGDCYGDCTFAKTVRNRDVIVPPLPDSSGRITSRTCPHLYETKSCHPKECQRQIEDSFPRPKPLPRQNEKVRATSNASASTTSFSSDDRPSHALRRIEVTTFTSQSEERPHSNLHDFTSSEDDGQPLKKINIEKLSQDPIMNDVLRQLESASDLNASLDDKKIRKALKKNKKLMKALVEAYRYNKQVSTTTKSTTPVVSTESTTVSTTEATKLEDVSLHITGNEIEEPTTTTTTTTATTSLPYWKRKGYVPNSRKHASEITSKLYMTKEIVQALSADPVPRPPILRLDCLENNRCCRVDRKICPDGSRPTYVKRYYRPHNSPECFPYHYPRCSATEEMEEQPIEFLQNCQDLCFNSSEKHISPFFPIA